MIKVLFTVDMTGSSLSEIGVKLNSSFGSSNVRPVEDYTSILGVPSYLVEVCVPSTPDIFMNEEMVTTACTIMNLLFGFDKVGCEDWSIPK
jgi:hypothetical protein